MRHKKLLERSKMFLFLLPHLLDFRAGIRVLEDIILALVNNICSSFASVVYPNYLFVELARFWVQVAVGWFSWDRHGAY